SRPFTRRSRGPSSGTPSRARRSATVAPSGSSTRPAPPRADGGPYSARFAKRRTRTSTRAGTVPSGAVDLAQLAGRPLHGVLRSRALEAPREHVDQDVLRQGFRRLAAGWPRIADLPGRLKGLAEDGGLRILRPQRVVEVDLRPGNPERVHGLEVLVVLGPVHVEADEVLGDLLVLRVLHHAAVPRRQPVEAAGGARRIMPVVRAAIDVGRLLPSRHVDAGRVAGQRDVGREERAVVVRVVPAEAALVEYFLPEHVVELHRLDDGLGVEHDGLPVLVDLHAAPHPHERIAPVVRVIDAVAERLPERPALRLERPARRPELVPGLRVLEPQLLEPVLAVGDGPRDDEL